MPKIWVADDGSWGGYEYGCIGVYDITDEELQQLHDGDEFDQLERDIEGKVLLTIDVIIEGLAKLGLCDETGKVIAE